MDIEAIGADPFGTKAYADLFEEIMCDLNKAVLIDKVKLLMKPEVPLFVFSVTLRAEPVNKTIADVANVRAEGSGVHLTITDERYAPEILASLWKRYGRNAVYQQTRMDMDVANAKDSDMLEMVVSSGEKDTQEIMGAIWRTMPEGIKNRRTLISGSIITVVATEEVLTPEMLAEGRAIHESMGGVA